MQHFTQAELAFHFDQPQFDKRENRRAAKQRASACQKSIFDTLASFSNFQKKFEKLLD
jgi:hypothetical protein